jgi:hypothetical protein
MNLFLRRLSAPGLQWPLLDFRDDGLRENDI